MRAKQYFEQKNMHESAKYHIVAIDDHDEEVILSKEMMNAPSRTPKMNLRHAAFITSAIPVHRGSLFARSTTPLQRHHRPLTVINPKPARLLSMRIRSTPPAPLPERLISITPYVIPLLDALSFGKYVFSKIPLLGNVILAPLYPIYAIYRGVPFLAFGVFLALYLLVVRNSSISPYIRFNVYQALILDIVLIFPQLFQGFNLGGMVGASVAEICTTAVFYAISLAIGYAVVSNARGYVPDEIPGISESVRQQMGPF